MQSESTAQTTAVKGAKLNDEPLPITPTEKPKPAAKEQTPEEKANWKKVQDKVHSRMFPNAKPDKEEKAPAKAAAKEKAEATTEDTKAKGKSEATAPAKQPAKKESTDDSGKQGEKEKAKVETTEEEPKLKPSAKKEATPPSVDLEKLATSVATATAKAIKESEKKETKVEDEVPEGRRRDVAAIEFLEKNNPKYKGKLDAYKKFARAEAELAAKWEKENPGRKFDPTDEDHSDWYDKHEPDIDPDDITEARVELAAERRASALVEQATGSTKKEIDSLKLERDLERAERPIPNFVSRAFAKLAEAMGEDVMKAAAELKDAETLEDKDPAAHQTINALMPDLHNQTVAAARIFGTQGRAYDAKDPNHVAVAKAALELENVILEMPADEQKTPDGRTFAKLDEWAAMSDADKAKHWTIDANSMSLFLANKAAEKAKETYTLEREKAEKIAKAYGFIKNGEAHKEQVTKREEREEEADTNDKVRSPSTSSRTIVQPGVTASPQTAKTGGDRMLDRMFRR